MGIAKHIYETLKALFERQATEIVDFDEFVKSKLNGAIFRANA